MFVDIGGVLARYILRLDDAHPRMNIGKWLEFESLCDEYDIKPVVAIIPDNQDDEINYSEVVNYKEVIERWNAKGWEFALHGYQHKLHMNSTKQMVNINDYSEFVGLSKSTQAYYIREGLKRLEEINVYPKIWIAPAHGFDKNTLHALKESSNINIISDGLAFWPFLKHGFKWVPQQLWSPRSIPFGLWTICYHPSSCSIESLDKLEDFLKENSHNFIAMDEVFYYRKRNSIFDYALQLVFKLKKLKSKIKYDKK